MKVISTIFFSSFMFSLVPGTSLLSVSVQHEAASLQRGEDLFSITGQCLLKHFIIVLVLMFLYEILHAKLKANFLILINEERVYIFVEWFTGSQCFGTV